jgi:branched-chain amino acid transport system substrate-binding protein
VANRREVAVIGARSSICSKIQVPILNKATDGPMLMVTHTDTNPGLTKTWEAGEPAMYLPTGQRSFARVVATDDTQGVAAAQFAARELGVRKCFVLNDGDTYGVGLAKSFTTEAVRLGIQIVGEAVWLLESAHYRGLFGRAKGADCVYFGGVYDIHGDQLIRDKVAVLGDNNMVKVLAPDGFSGYPDFLLQPEASGAYLTYTGLMMEGLAAGNGSLEQFLADYRSRYGANPESQHAIYGVQALQVILAAIEKSDGTRRGVWEQVFGGMGITIAADIAIIGKPVSIDPTTGDVSAKDISIAVVKDGKETFVAAWPVA